MRRALTAGFVTLVLASPSAAQESKAFELGLDGMIAHRLTAPTATAVTLPVSRMRVGYFLAPNFSFEPSLSYEASSSNGARSSLTTIGFAIVPQFSAIGSVKVYARPFVDLNFRNATSAGQTSSSQTTSVGAGLGLRVPMATRLMWRFEAAYASQTNESRLMGLIGFSFFTN